MKIKGLESETSQSEFIDQQNIEADHYSSFSEDHDFYKYLDKVEKDQMKKRHLDVYERLNIKLKKLEQHFHQAVELKEKYNRSRKLLLEELIPLSRIYLTYSSYSHSSSSDLGQCALLWKW